MPLKERMLQKRIKKASKKGFRGYPVATIAYYGPDDMHASKVAVGIVMHDGGDAEILERWFSDTTDVRADTEINSEIARFIEDHAARSVVSSGRIIGCPHEEGVDYPEGEKCPKCPFWANRDRWSGKILH